VAQNAMRQSKVEFTAKTLTNATTSGREPERVAAPAVRQDSVSVELSLRSKPSGK